MVPASLARWNYFNNYIIIFCQCLHRLLAVWGLCKQLCLIKYSGVGASQSKHFNVKEEAASEHCVCSSLFVHV